MTMETAIVELVNAGSDVFKFAIDSRSTWLSLHDCGAEIIRY